MNRSKYDLNPRQSPGQPSVAGAGNGAATPTPFKAPPGVPLAEESGKPQEPKDEDAQASNLESEGGLVDDPVPAIEAPSKAKTEHGS